MKETLYKEAYRDFSFLLFYQLGRFPTEIESELYRKMWLKEYEEMECEEIQTTTTE